MPWTTCWPVPCSDLPLYVKLSITFVGLVIMTRHSCNCEDSILSFRKTYLTDLVAA